MSDEQFRQGMLDTNILILPKWIDPAELPDEMTISAITLAELSAGPRRCAVTTSRKPTTSTPSARVGLRSRYGPRASSTQCRWVPRQPVSTAAVTAAVIAAGRKPRGRVVDLMIAATAIADGLPLYTTNPAGFSGLDALIRIVPISRPPVPHEQPAHRHCPGV